MSRPCDEHSANSPRRDVTGGVGQWAGGQQSSKVSCRSNHPLILRIVLIAPSCMEYVVWYCDQPLLRKYGAIRSSKISMFKATGPLRCVGSLQTFMSFDDRRSSVRWDPPRRVGASLGERCLGIVFNALYPSSWMSTTFGAHLDMDRVHVRLTGASRPTRARSTTRIDIEFERRFDE